MAMANQRLLDGWILSQDLALTSRGLLQRHDTPNTVSSLDEIIRISRPFICDLKPYAVHLGASLLSASSESGLIRGYTTHEHGR